MDIYGYMIIINYLAFLDLFILMALKNKKIFGNNKIHMLSDIASSVEPKPTEPDLFAYKKNENGDAKYDMVFIEVKRKDQVSKGQHLGIELIEKYLRIACRIVRYKEIIK